MTKRRFITIELSPDMSDFQEEKLKESIAQGIKDLRLRDNDAALFIPKVAIRTKFEDDSEIVVVNNKIIISN